jgi:mono/diheme cytochrome c family protein
VHRILALGIAAAFMIVSVSVLSAESQQTPQAAPQGNVEKGRESFKTHGCTSCHGYSAWGGTGARLAQNPITFQAFVSYVRKPKGTMPAFGSQVTPAELADIFAFIKSIPPSPDPKTIPLLNDKN